MIIRTILYLFAIVCSNLLVARFGLPGMLISSLLLIPFDFVIRAYFHERLRGIQLMVVLAGLVATGALITFAFNANAIRIGIGSVCAFVFANAAASAFYQVFMRKDLLIKVNGSDVVAIIVDSLVFQAIAFGTVVWPVTAGQMALKIIGGFFWYLVLFKCGTRTGKFTGEGYGSFYILPTLSLTYDKSYIILDVQWGCWYVGLTWDREL